MDEKRLRQLEAELNARGALRPDDQDYFYETAIHELIAEMRRLQAAEAEIPWRVPTSPGRRCQPCCGNCRSPESDPGEQHTYRSSQNGPRR